MLISDLQAPGQHLDTLPFLDCINTTFKCDTYGCVGDEIDFSKFSIKHMPDPNSMSAPDEYYKAIEFMKKLYLKYPICDVAISNHTMRPFKKAAYAGIPEIFMKDYHALLEAPDTWRWKDRHEIDGFIMEHGMGYGGIMGHRNAAIKNRKPTIIGHLSSHAGINYVTNFEGEVLWGMNVGCLIDVTSSLFNYGKYLGDKPCIGTGVVINGVPIYLPMKLDKYGRWTGRL